MPGFLFTGPKFQGFDNNGYQLSGGKLYSYIAGTTTPTPTYPTKADADAGTNANANPIILDSRGEASVYPVITTKFVLTTADGVVIWTVDNVPFTGATGIYYFVDYNEVDQGVAGNGKSVNAYIGTIGTKSATLIFQHNSGGATTTYTFGTSITIPNNIKVEIHEGAMLSVATSKTVIIGGTLESSLSRIFTGSGSVKFGDQAYREVNSVWWGGKGDYLTDNTASLQAASNAIIGGIINLPPGRCKFGSKVTFGNTGSRGAYTIKGCGTTFHLTNTPTTANGTTIIWTGSATGTLFEFGGGPLYIAGVSQGFDTAQFGNKIQDLSIIFQSGITSVFYVHDQDSFQLINMFIDGLGEKAIRGVTDFRGAVNNIRLQQVTMANIPNGYGVRIGDGSDNNLFDQVFMENVGLSYWIGDTKVYEDPYQNGRTTWSECTFEGLSGEGKFSVNTLNAAVTAGNTSVVVVDGTLFAVDDPVYIDRLHDKFEMNRVVSVSTNTLNLAYALEYDHASGAIIKAGRIGVHAGKSSTGTGRTTNLSFKGCMWDRIGCCIDAHNVENINIDHPFFVSNQKRGMFFDGDVQNITLINPRVLGDQLAAWRLFEITSRGGTYNFHWFGGADKSGVVTPYINSQGDIDGFYIGSFKQTTSGYPAYFRGITFDSNGIILRETDSAIGLKYQTGANTNFEVTPAGLGKFNSGIEIYGGNFSANSSGQTHQVSYADFGDIGAPAAPAAGKNRLFFERWGSPSKGHLYVIFPTGAKQLIASEP